MTLTHADITRYFMTIPEASQLVLQASSIAKGGDVFVLEMGEPIKISRLADTMIRLHQRQIEQAGGRAPEIAIEIIGLRPGDKMYEELHRSRLRTNRGTQSADGRRTAFELGKTGTTSAPALRQPQGGHA